MFAAFGVVLTAAYAALPSQRGPVGRDASTFVLTFFDDFTTPTLNTSIWNVRANESHCAPCEPELYVPWRVFVEPNATADANGTLVIETARDHIQGPGGEWYNFTSGWVDTHNKWSQLFGMFEVRARLPPQNATGIWPAHWLMPQGNVCWPVGGEIDIMEYTANPLVNDVFGSYRWGTQCNVDLQPLPGAAYPPFGAPAIDWAADFHVFAVEFNASALTFYVDGNAYETKTSAEVHLPTLPQYWILDTAVAWYWMPGPDAAYPARHEIDWVRAWAYA